jgi:hypothetical protein
MKNLFILFTLLFSCGKICSQESIIEAENLNTLGLSGKVKTLTEASYKAKKTTAGIVKSTKGWQYEFENDSESHFDTLGNLILENKIEAGKKEAVYSIKYDSLHRIVLVSRFYFTHTFVYDSLNKITSSQKKNRQPETGSKASFAAKTETGRRFLYYYNDQNLLIKTESFDDQSEAAIETFQYGPSGKLILNEWTKGNYTETHQYTYNEDWLLIKEELRDNVEGILETTNYSYKGKERILEHWVDYEKGKPDGYINETFEKGNPIKTVEVDSDGTIAATELCTYQFDSKGNWIKKTITSDEEYYIVERIIAYY